MKGTILIHDDKLHIAISCQVLDPQTKTYTFIQQYMPLGKDDIDYIEYAEVGYDDKLFLITFKSVVWFQNKLEWCRLKDMKTHEIAEFAIWCRQHKIKIYNKDDSDNFSDNFTNELIHYAGITRLRRTLKVNNNFIRKL